MSEEDMYVEIEDEDDSGSGSENPTSNQGHSSSFSEAEKRAHHNALERKRRDQIKASFSRLKEIVPALQGAQVASRADILLKTSKYIQAMTNKNKNQQQNIEELKKQNMILALQIEQLEKTKEVISFSDFSLASESEESDMDDDDDDDDEGSCPKRPMLKTTNYANTGFL